VIGGTAVGGGTDSVRLFDLADGTEVWTFHGPYQNVESIAIVFDRDLGWLVTFSCRGGPHVG
jgi:hypothetical protein